ncbi:hypothetical protein IQ07DRAFT_417324 [Pyrenochaeta sp. DS3sAY3a]|nr:hypothetical protein IQ07DRAFT_417324 [Pyrenochaeta sp. DS3sAY3a]
MHQFVRMHCLPSIWSTKYGFFQRIPSFKRTFSFKCIPSVKCTSFSAIENASSILGRYSNFFLAFFLTIFIPTVFCLSPVLHLNSPQSYKYHANLLIHAPALA